MRAVPAANAAHVVVRPSAKVSPNKTSLRGCRIFPSTDLIGVSDFTAKPRRILLLRHRSRTNFVVVLLLETFLDWNVEGNRVYDAQALELHPDAVHAGTRKCHVELDVLHGTA